MEKTTPTVDKLPLVVDVTPTWAQILNALLLIYTDGDAKGRTFAHGELQRMASLADAFVEASKLYGLSITADEQFEPTKGAEL